MCKYFCGRYCWGPRKENFSPFFYISQTAGQQVEGGDSPLLLFFFSLEFMVFLKSTLCLTEENCHNTVNVNYP